MRYMLLLYANAEEDRRWAEADETERAEIYAKHGAFAEMLTQRGALVGGDELALSHTATTVRKDGRDGGRHRRPVRRGRRAARRLLRGRGARPRRGAGVRQGGAAPTVEVRPIVESEAPA